MLLDMGLGSAGALPTVSALERLALCWMLCEVFTQLPLRRDR
jgi:hypothetical protein